MKGRTTKSAYVASLHFGVTAELMEGEPPIDLKILEKDIAEELLFGKGRKFRAETRLLFERAGGGPIVFMPNPGVRVTPVEGGA